MLENEIKVRALHIIVIHEIISTRCACRSSWRKLLMWSSLFEKTKICKGKMVKYLKQKDSFKT